MGCRILVWASLLVLLGLRSIPQAFAFEQTSGKDAATQEKSTSRSAVVTPPVVVYKVPPEYPEGMRRSGIEGFVLLGIVVTKDGVPQDIRVLKSLHPDFDQKAIEAVQRWKFRPSLRDGNPIPRAATVQVNFAILDEKGQHLPLETEPEERKLQTREPNVEPSASSSGTGSVAGRRNADSSDRTPGKHPGAKGDEDVDFFGSPQTVLRSSTSKLRMRSKNFLLVSDWTDKDQHGQLLLALERARALFLHLYNRVPAGVVKVIVNQSLAETRATCRTSQGLGCSASRGGEHLIVLSTAAFSNGVAPPAVHEYTHVAQNLMGYASAPPWVTEGIACYYENVEFQNGKLYVGYFDPKRSRSGWFPIESILDCDYHTLKDDLGRAAVQGFYGESHLLIHMLRHTERYNVHLADFLSAVKKGKDSRELFRELYGVSSADLYNELVEYHRQRKYRQVEVYEGIRIPDTITIDGSGETVTVKERKCTWCGVRKVMRHMPIIIPIP